jgi:putative transposase
MPYWRLFYHIIWGTANREPLIQTEFEAALHNVIAAKAKSLGAFVYAVGGIEDHIHLVASIPPLRCSKFSVTLTARSLFNALQPDG